MVNVTRSVATHKQRSLITIILISLMLIGGGFTGWGWWRSRQPTGPQIPAGTARVNPKDGAMMVWVPAGSFMMGADASVDIASVKPRHKVYLDGYWIYKTEVTVAQFQHFCTVTGYPMPKAPPWGWIDNHPIINIRWKDAAAYAKWAGASLPTEAQWEKAARGTDGRIFPWGNDWDPKKLHCANTTISSGLRIREKLKETDHTVPVGSYPAGASPYSCLDMAGNAREWCIDWYDEKYYHHSPSRNPQGPKSIDDMTEDRRVMRGGSWFTPRKPVHFTTYQRTSGYSFYPTEVNGFRCVVNLQ